MKYYIDEIRYQEGVITVNGWAVPAVTSHPLSVKVTDKLGGEVEGARVIMQDRIDVVKAMADDAPSSLLGFHATFPVAGTIVMSDSEDESDTAKKTITAAYAMLNTWGQNVKDNANFVKGFIKSENKGAYLRNTEKNTKKRYEKWYKDHQPDKLTLNRQATATLAYSPLISVIVPVYNPRPEHLLEMVRSVKAQTYSNWQLCLANGSGQDAKLSALIRKLASEDERIKNARLRTNRGISGNTNVALKIADGGWIALMDQDDIIPPNAFYEYVEAMNADRSVDAIYCDEDKLDDETGKHYDPNFKSDFNIDLLTCNNYICHMFMVRKSVADAAGPFDPAFDGAQDHDFILRCVEKSRKVCHIPKVLYSWRSHMASTDSEGAAKTYAFDAGVRAVQAYYDRNGIPGKVSPAQCLGWYKTDFTLKEEPLISVLIPNKDHIGELDTCITSILEKITYKNYEIIVIENNSEEQGTFDYYKTMTERDPRIRLITWEKEFNYSAINNFGARESKGDYLLLLNNDTEVISPDLFTSMMGYCQRKDVGAVGAKLLYADDTVQHAGVLIGVEHAAHHVFLRYGADDPGYLGRAIVSQDISGVTAACMLVKKSVFDEVGGLDEDFVVAYNDVDLCLKIGAAGYLIVYDAFVRLHHYESKSRGYELSEEQKERFESEKKRLLEKWGKRLDYDPYYNKNLTSLKNGYYKL